MFIILVRLVYKVYSTHNKQIVIKKILCLKSNKVKAIVSNI